MIFTLENVPRDISDPQCITKGFNNETTPLVFEKAIKINEDRRRFLYFFANLENDSKFTPSLKEFRKKAQFLADFVDFMETGRESNYNFAFGVRLFLHGPKGIDSNSRIKAMFEKLVFKDDSHLNFQARFDLEKNLVFAHIVHVYIYFLGVMKYVFRKSDEHVQDYLENESFNGDTFDQILEVFKLGFGRLLKVVRVRDSLLGFLSSEQMPEDFSIGTLDILGKVYQVNYVNMVIYKIMFRGDNFKQLKVSSKLNKLYVVWVKEALSLVEGLRQSLFSCSFNWKTDLQRFLNTLSVYYRILYNTFIMRFNFVLEREKDSLLEEQGSPFLLLLDYRRFY